MSPRQDIPLSGSFNCWAQAFDLPDLLLKICGLKQTGELRFMSSEAEKTVVLHDGAMVFAKSSSADDRLGPHLLKARKIRFEHLTELSRFVTPERRFGAVLVDNGVLTPHDLVQGVIGQVRSIILSLFQWTEAAYIFEEKELAKETIELSIPLPRLIVDGVRDVSSWRRIAQGIGALDAVYQSSDGIDDRVNAAKLDPKELGILSDLRGPKTIAEACASSELSDIEVCQLLWAFMAMGWLTPVDQSSQAPPPPQTSEPETPPQVPVVEATLAELPADTAPPEDSDLEGLGSVLNKKPLQE